MSDMAITLLEICLLVVLGGLSIGFVYILSKNLPEYELPVPFNIRVAVSIFVGYFLNVVVLAILLIIDILDPNRNWDIKILSVILCVGSPITLVAMVGTFLNISILGKVLSVLKIYPKQKKQ